MPIQHKTKPTKIPMEGLFHQTLKSEITHAIIPSLEHCFFSSGISDFKQAFITSLQTLIECLLLSGSLILIPLERKAAKRVILVCCFAIDCARGYVDCKVVHSKYCYYVANNETGLYMSGQCRRNSIGCWHSDPIVCRFAWGRRVDGLLLGTARGRDLTIQAMRMLRCRALLQCLP